MNRNQHYVIKK